MSIEAPQGILNIPNATLRVGKLAVNELLGVDTVINTIARNTILLVDGDTYHENKNWDLKLPNAWAGEFECNTASAGNYSEFNFYNEGASSNAQGYNLTFNDTAAELRYDGTLLTSGTLPSTVTGTGVKKVRLMFERTILSVTVDGTLIFTHDDTGGPRPRVYSTTAGGFLNFFTDGGALKNLKIVNEKWISDGTSNIAYVGGNVTLGAALDVVGNVAVDTNTLFVDTVGSKVGVGTTDPLTSLHLNTTDALVLPIGTGSQRPSNTIDGMIRLNTSLNSIEYYKNNWISLAPVSTPITTRGLLVSLDASDATSYSGSGSTWYSTVAGDRHGSIQGNVSWTGNGQASYFDFPGANSDRVVQSGGTAKLYKDICIVFKVDALNNSFAYLVSNGGDQSLRVGSGGIGNTSGNNGDWSNGGSGTTYYVNGTATTSDVPITNGQWYILGGESKLYTSTFNYNLGWGFNSRALNGKIAFVALYEYALTATEQVQNYNALKARFGL